MKGLEMNIINLVILVIAIVLLGLLITKLIPAFGDFVSNSLKAIKKSFCESLGFLGQMFC
ncbi:MAG: hypothetical protein QXR09_03635 [Candidatus Aenigmatarchaeota archaeon]